MAHPYGLCQSDSTPMKGMPMRRLILALTLLLMPLPTLAQEAETPPEPSMTLDRLGQIIAALDPDAEANGRFWQMQVGEVPILIITDPENDRMRALAPVREAEGLSQEDLMRMMQANFDTALDARYAIAKEMVWSVYIHPFGALEKNEFIAGLGQVANLATSYGTLYSGGLMQFGGGDSGELQRQLIDELLKKGEAI